MDIVIDIKWYGLLLHIFVRVTFKDALNYLYCIGSE